MPKDEERRTFTGFYSPRATPVPDNFFDEVLPDLSGAEVKVLLYVFRRTFGFKKNSDNISLSQMVSGIRRKDGTPLDRGTGLSKASVSRALNLLIGKGMVRRIKRRNAVRGDRPSTYEPVIADDIAVAIQPVSQNKTRGVSKVDTGLSQNETHKKQGNKKQFNNTVTGGGSLLKSLPDREQETDETEDVLQEILGQMPDANVSERFYRLVARKVSPHIIRQALAEIRQDGARNPAKLFTYKMEQYALKKLKSGLVLQAKTL